MKQYTVYVLRSLLTGQSYVGVTHNLRERIKQHNAGRCRSTKSFSPWEVVYSESYRSRSKAVLRERYFKTGAGRSRLKKILE